MSDIADELARQAQPERVKEIATGKASEWKERAKQMASDKASELKHQAKEAATEKATEVKTRAKEAVMHKTMEMKERADTPRGWGLLGAIIGAGVGATLMKKAFDLRKDRYDSSGIEGFEDLRYRGESYSSVGYGSPAVGVSGDISAVGVGTEPGLGVGTEPGLKERASETTHSMKDKAKDKASELKDRAKGAVDQARDRTSHLRERIPSGGELKGRASHLMDRGMDAQPLLIALGGIALGMIASMLVPVSNRERQLLEPAKSKAKERISHLRDQLDERVENLKGESGSDVERGPRGDVGVSGIEDRSESLASPTGSRIPPQPPLDDLTKLH